MDDDALPGLVFRGRSMLDRAMRLADTCNNGDNLGAPSDWIHNSEHDDWFKDAGEYVDARFNADSAQRAQWDRAANGGSPLHERDMMLKNPYVGYVTLYRRSLEYLEGLPAVSATPAAAAPSEASPLQKFVEGIMGSIHYAYRRAGAFGVVAIIVAGVAIFAAMNAKAVAEGYETLSRYAGGDVPKPPTKKVEPK